MCIWIAQAWRAAAAQTELLPRLRAGRNTQLRLALDSRDFNLRSECCLGYSDRHRHIDVVTLAGEVLMPSNVSYDVKIARGRPQPSAFAFAGHAHTRASIDACRYSNLYRFSLGQCALAFTERARRPALAGAPAVRTLLS